MFSSGGDVGGLLRVGAMDFGARDAVQVIVETGNQMSGVGRDVLHAHRLDPRGTYSHRGVIRYRSGRRIRFNQQAVPLLARGVHPLFVEALALRPMPLSKLSHQISRHSRDQYDCAVR